MSFRRDWYILTGLHVTVFIGCAQMMPPPSTTSERGTVNRPLLISAFRRPPRVFVRVQESQNIDKP